MANAKLFLCTLTLHIRCSQIRHCLTKNKIKTMSTTTSCLKDNEDWHAALIAVNGTPGEQGTKGQHQTDPEVAEYPKILPKSSNLLLQHCAAT